MDKIDVHPMKQIRKDLDLSQLDVSLGTQLSVSTIKHAENGDGIDRQTIGIICTYFQEEHGLQVTAKELGLKEGRKKRESQKSGSYSTKDNEVEISQERDDMDAKRRQLLGNIVEITGITMLPQVFLDTDEIDRLTSTLTKFSLVDTKTLTGLKTTTENYWGLRVSGGVSSPDLLDAVRKHLKIVEQLLLTSLTPTSRTALCSIVSETALLIGKILDTDMHKHDEALFYYKIGLQVAQQTNNDALYAAGLGRMASLATNANRPHDARLLLQRAQFLVKDTHLFTLRSWLIAEEAERQAEIDAREKRLPSDLCFEGLEKAELLAQHIHPEEETFGMYFDMARISGYEGTCNIHLQRPEKALTALSKALHPFESSGVLTREVLLDMAEASLQAVTIEQTCGYLRQALELSVQSQAKSPLQRIYKIRHRLEPWKTLQEVKDFDEQLSYIKMAN